MKRGLRAAWASSKRDSASHPALFSLKADHPALCQCPIVPFRPVLPAGKDLYCTLPYAASVWSSTMEGKSLWQFDSVEPVSCLPSWHHVQQGVAALFLLAKPCYWS